MSHGITGNWRGHYTYSSSPDEGSSFDAIFVEHKGSLKGNIHDDNMLGEASLNGTFAYPEVRFKKVYYTPGLHPIMYDGQMSSDGKTITGKWSIFIDGGDRRLHGTWMAYRTDPEDKNKAQQEKSEPIEIEKVR